jgi:NhaP-type Na+/H+ or K+/H+ antiporter
MSAFGRTRISHEADRAIHEFWEYVVYASETVIFLLGGIIVAIRVLKDESEITTLDFYKLIPLWGCAFVGRFMSIGLFMHWLKKWGYGLVWKEVIVLAYGGLRGAVGITFALIVAKDESLDDKLKDIILF